MLILGFFFIFQKTNPELAAEIIAEQEMGRTLERATLKHSKANRNKKLAFKTQVRTFLYIIWNVVKDGCILIVDIVNSDTHFLLLLKYIFFKFSISLIFIFWFLSG
jgi:hypothetical protein